MDMDQAAVWLAGSILFTIGFVVLIAGIVAINNVLHKYWKPIRIFTEDSWKGFMPPVGSDRYSKSEEPILDKKDLTRL